MKILKTQYYMPVEQCLIFMEEGRLRLRIVYQEANIRP